MASCLINHGDNFTFSSAVDVDCK